MYYAITKLGHEGRSDTFMLTKKMALPKFEIFLFVALCLFQIYVALTFWKWSVGFVFLYLGHRIIKAQEARDKLTIPGKAVLVTGCDTGFGHHFATSLVDRGFTVYAGVLDVNGDGAKALRSRQTDGLHVIKLDVTKDDDVNSALTYVKSRESGGLWAVVNNAGLNFPGDVELATVNQYRHCADINLFGTIRVIKAFLPLIRQTKGRIVNISSVRGQFSNPGNSVYHVTKYGIETMSDSLRMEMKQFGVKVVIIEPGDFSGGTSITGPAMIKRMQKDMDHMWDSATDEVRRTYGRDYFNRFVPTINDNTPVTSTDPVVDAVEDAIISVNPKHRYMVPGYSIDMYYVIARVYHLLSVSMADLLMEKITGYPSVLQQQ